MGATERVGRAGHLDDDHLHQLRVISVGVDDELRDRIELLAAADGLVVDLLDRGQEQRPALDEELVEDLILGLEVVIDEPVCDARLVGDVRDAAGVESLPGEHADRCVQDLATLVHRRRLGAHRATSSCMARYLRTDGLRPSVGARTPVGERRQRRADSILYLEIQVGSDEALAVGRFREDGAPRIHDHRMSVGAVVGRRLANLVRGDDERLVLDRPRPEENFPMVFAGLEGEGGRHCQHRCAADREDAVELREPKVVADGHAERDSGQRFPDRSRHDLVTGLLVIGLPVRDAADVHVEHVDLPVTGMKLVGPDGELHARYRKIHMFDVDVGGVSYRESDNEEPGDEIVAAAIGESLPGVMLGMTVCYDLRFPELYRILAVRGATVLTVPSAFTFETGKDHWEVLLRARAIENQAFVVAPNQVGEAPPHYRSYGHSMIVDPWGAVLAEAPDGECFVTADLDLEVEDRVRATLPSLANRRPGSYRWPETIRPEVPSHA